MIRNAIKPETQKIGVQYLLLEALWLRDDVPGGPVTMFKLWNNQLDDWLLQVVNIEWRYERRRIMAISSMSKRFCTGE